MTTGTKKLKKMHIRSWKKKLDQQIFEEENMPSKLYYKNMNVAKRTLIF